MRGISRLAEELLASEEGLCSMVLFSRTFWAITSHVGWESAATLFCLLIMFMFPKSAMEGLSPVGCSHFFYGSTAPSGPGSAHCRGFTITLRYSTLGRTPLDVWMARRRDFYLTTHNNPKGIQTDNPSQWAAENPRLRRRGNRGRRVHIVRSWIILCSQPQAC